MGGGTVNLFRQRRSSPAADYFYKFHLPWITEPANAADAHATQIDNIFSTLSTVRLVLL